jgi:hypothetical protein
VRNVIRTSRRREGGSTRRGLAKASSVRAVEANAEGISGCGDDGSGRMPRLESAKRSESPSYYPYFLPPSAGVAILPLPYFLPSSESPRPPFSTSHLLSSFPVKRSFPPQHVVSGHLLPSVKMLLPLLHSWSAPPLSIRELLFPRAPPWPRQQHLTFSL